MGLTDQTVGRGRSVAAGTSLVAGLADSIGIQVETSGTPTGTVGLESGVGFAREAVVDIGSKASVAGIRASYAIGLAVEGISGT